MRLRDYLLIALMCCLPGQLGRTTRLAVRLHFSRPDDDSPAAEVDPPAPPTPEYSATSVFCAVVEHFALDYRDERTVDLAPEEYYELLVTNAFNVSTLDLLRKNFPRLTILVAGSPLRS